MPTIHIIPATPDDAARIHSITARAFEQYHGILVPQSSVFRETIDSIREKLTKGGGFVARFDDHDAGSILYAPEEDHMYLGRLAVLPDYRGKGIAHALIQAVEDHTRAKHITSVQLGVRLVLENNLQFFTSLGYQIISYGTHEGFTEPTYATMSKSLPT